MLLAYAFFHGTHQLLEEIVVPNLTTTLKIHWNQCLVKAIVWNVAEKCVVSRYEIVCNVATGRVGHWQIDKSVMINSAKRPTNHTCQYESIILPFLSGTRTFIAIEILDLAPMTAKVAKDHISGLTHFGHILKGIGDILAGRFGMFAIIQHERNIFVLKAMDILQIFNHLVVDSSSSGLYEIMFDS